MKQQLAKHIKNKLNLLNTVLGKEYSYSCLPLAALDAVYSIRQDYKQTQKIVDNYCGYYGIAKYKGDSNKKIHTVSEFISNIEKNGVEQFAVDVLHSKNMTAGGQPILKAEAVYEFCEILRKNGIEKFDNFAKSDKDKLEKELLQIHGQGQAVVKYFFMLCGNDNFCKPDRHILKFLSEVVEKEVNADEAQKLLETATDELKSDYPNMTVRLLDYVIWNYQRNKS